jgi:hypothetical protein
VQVFGELPGFGMMSYPKIAPIDVPIPAERQSARRHYGVHPYFTRRPHNVVRSYILRYTREKDVVVDPFGGSGVTAIEAWLENRVGVQNDINPLANFIAEGVVNLSRGSIRDYTKALSALRERCERKLLAVERMSPAELEVLRQDLKMPRNIRLPRSSDVLFYHELFSPHQLASLALLKDAIDGISPSWLRRGMLLAWSATLAKVNKTFLSAEGRAESRGGSSIFSIYRYKVAKMPVELPVWQTFEERFSNVIAAKAEIDKTIEVKQRTTGWYGKFESYAEDIDALARRLKSQADYIFTDPPYGGHISYLDLSTLWNCWLDQMPSDSARGRELIVGGELAIQESSYVRRLGDAVTGCLSMLKKDRWMSVVFQHWNPAYFEAILSSAASEGAELRTAISQIGDPIWSMHKKKGSESVLAGEMILTFIKSGRRTLTPVSNDFDVSDAVKRVLSEVEGNEIYGELLFNKIIIAAWREGAIRSLGIAKSDFIHLIKKNGWHYDASRHCWARGLARGEASLFADAEYQ